MHQKVDANKHLYWEKCWIDSNHLPPSSATAHNTMWGRGACPTVPCWTLEYLYQCATDLIIDSDILEWNTRHSSQPVFVGEINDLIFVSIHYSYLQGNYVMGIEIVGSSLSFESVNRNIVHLWYSGRLFSYEVQDPYDVFNLQINWILIQNITYEADVTVLGISSGTNSVSRTTWSLSVNMFSCPHAYMYYQNSNHLQPIIPHIPMDAVI